MRLATARSAPPADRFVEAEATLSALVTRLQSEETARMSHSDLETLLEQQGRELMRQLLQAHLDWRAEAKPTHPVVGADGVERTHQRSGTRALERAQYRLLDDGTLAATVRGLRGVVATGATLETCRSDLTEVIEEWILVRVARRLAISALDGARI